MLLSLFQKYLFDRPAVLLTITMLMWAGNTVASRLAVPEMSPMVVSTFRWFFASLLMLSYSPKAFIQQWPDIKRHWKYITLQSIAGFSLFNALFYYAAHLTSGINLSIIQGSIPVFVLVGAFIWFGNRSTWMQTIGVAISLIGILTVASRGKIEIFQTLTFNLGDVLFLVACLSSAIYTLGLRKRPAIPSLPLFTILALAAFITSLPLAFAEYLNGDMTLPSLKGWEILVYIVIFPSTISQLFYMRAIEMIGAARASIFTNLIPVMGAVLSVLVLGEQFGLYHIAALALVLTGIMLAEWKKPQ